MKNVLSKYTVTITQSVEKHLDKYSIKGREIEENLISLTCRLYGVAGVYMFIHPYGDGADVMYIGKSNNLFYRVPDSFKRVTTVGFHGNRYRDWLGGIQKGIQSGLINPHLLLYIPKDKNEIDKWESLLIATHKPMFNLLGKDKQITEYDKNSIFDGYYLTSPIFKHKELTGVFKEFHNNFSKHIDNGQEYN